MCKCELKLRLSTGATDIECLHTATDLGVKVSNGNRNNVAECGGGTVATVSESGKAQEGDVEWIWETETLTVGFSSICPLRGTCRT